MYTMKRKNVFGIVKESSVSLHVLKKVEFRYMF